MKIVVITDGNNQLGMGHVYQSMTLASYLIEKINKKDELCFITKSDESVINLLKKINCPVFNYANDDLIFEALKNLKPDRIIVDKLDFAPELARKIKQELTSKLIIFTNLTEANKYADIAVLADIGSNFKNIITKSANGGIQFFGPKYWILRQDFYHFNKLGKIHKEIVKNIMLIFGGADPSNLSSLVLDELLQIDAEFNITLVLGSAFNNKEDVNAVLRKNTYSKSKVQVLQNITNVAQIMYNNDVVFASPGLSFFETLVVGTPVIGFHQNKLQLDAYANILPTMDKNELFKLPMLIKNKTFLYPTDPVIAKMEIGQGKDEIINEILN